MTNFEIISTNKADLGITDFKRGFIANAFHTTYYLLHTTKEKDF